MESGCVADTEVPSIAKRMKSMQAPIANCCFLIGWLAKNPHYTQNPTPKAMPESRSECNRLISAAMESSDHFEVEC
jgi:hypothetical protein